MNNATSSRNKTNYLDCAYSTAKPALHHVFSDEQITECRPTNTSTKTQRRCIERALRIAPCNTMFFREVLGICSPAPRIFELRHDQGLNVNSRFITVEDATGIEHKKVALYSLHAGTWTRHEP